MQHPCFRIKVDLWRIKYDEARIGDVQLIPPEDPARSPAATFSSLSYAIVKGERRLVRTFVGNDEEQREDWVSEVKLWHELKHPNLLQMHGFSKKSSPHLYVVFYDGQTRCLATYILESLNNSDVPSKVGTLAKMYNAALSAIKHIASQLRVNEAISTFLAEGFIFMLDSGNNLIISFSLLGPQGNEIQPLPVTLQDLFGPPLDFTALDSYFFRLRATDHTLRISNISIGQMWTVAGAFLSECRDLSRPM